MRRPPILHLPKVTHFKLEFGHSHIPSPAAQGILSLKRHPLYIRVTRQQQQREEQPLWLHFFTYKAVVPKRIVRAWCDRRLRRAIVKALEDRGYDASGRPIEASGVGNPAADQQRMPIRGSAFFSPFRSFVAATTEDINR